MNVAEIYNLNDKALSHLRGYIQLEMERRERVNTLVRDINLELAELMGELRGEDLFITNNLTGELVTKVSDWNKPDGPGQGDLSPALVIMRKGG